MNSIQLLSNTAALAGLTGATLNTPNGAINRTEAGHVITLNSSTGDDTVELRPYSVDGAAHLAITYKGTETVFGGNLLGASFESIVGCSMLAIANESPQAVDAVLEDLSELKGPTDTNSYSLAIGNVMKRLTSLREGQTGITVSSVDVLSIRSWYAETGLEPRNPSWTETCWMVPVLKNVPLHEAAELQELADDTADYLSRSTTAFESLSGEHEWYANADCQEDFCSSIRARRCDDLWTARAQLALVKAEGAEGINPELMEYAVESAEEVWNASAAHRRLSEDTYMDRSEIMEIVEEYTGETFTGLSESLADWMSSDELRKWAVDYVSE